MKKMLVTLCALIILTSGMAQTVLKKEAKKEELKKDRLGFDKKFIVGLSLNQYWSTIQGSDLPTSYFVKPSTGVLISAEYYPLSFLGVGLGAGFQQRGAGVVHQGNSDSTHRERLRFNTVEFPISITLRTPKDILKGFRLGGSVAVVPMINLHSRDVLNVVEPSIRDMNVVHDVSPVYFKNDMAYQLTFGPEFNCGTGIFKIHFVYSMGTANVYTGGQGTGHNQTMGVRLSAMF